jgi:hypothetical protein
MLGSCCPSVAEHLREQKSVLERVCRARNIQVDVGELADELQRYRRVHIYPFPALSLCYSFAAVHEKLVLLRKGIVQPDKIGPKVSVPDS